MATRKTSTKKTPAHKRTVSRKPGASERAAKAKADTKATSETVKAGEIPLKNICGDLGIDPKPARVKLRKYWRGDKARDPEFHELRNRWTFTEAEAKEIRAVLAPSE